MNGAAEADLHLEAFDGLDDRDFETFSQFLRELEGNATIGELQFCARGPWLAGKRPTVETYRLMLEAIRACDHEGNPTVESYTLSLRALRACTAGDGGT